MFSWTREWRLKYYLLKFFTKKCPTKAAPQKKAFETIVSTFSVQNDTFESLSVRR